MRGVAVHLAPAGAGGMEIDQLFFFGTNIVNAIHLPSGDQLASATFSVARVTWLEGPSESIHFTKICVPFGSPSDV